MATNINRDYLITLNVKSGAITAPSMYFFNTDKSTNNIYVQLVSKCSVLENVESTFQGCTGLNGELSSNIFTKKNNPRITNFKYTFNGCSNLEGYAPPLWTQYPGIDGEGCFAGCNKLGDIADVPTQWK